jgi:hypothetical protein
MLNTVITYRISGEQLVIGSPHLLRRSFSNTQSIDMVICDYLLLPNSTEVLLPNFGTGVPKIRRSP